MLNKKRATECVRKDCATTNISAYASDAPACRVWLPALSAAFARGEAFHTACVPSRESGGRNNVAFVGQRNGEARLKGKAKSDWNTLVYVRLSSSVLFPASFGPRYRALATVVSAPFIFCITISGMCMCACASVNSYKIKTLHWWSIPWLGNKNVTWSLWGKFQRYFCRFFRVPGFVNTRPPRKFTDVNLKIVIHDEWPRKLRREGIFAEG